MSLTSIKVNCDLISYPLCLYFYFLYLIIFSQQWFLYFPECYIFFAIPSLGIKCPCWYSVFNTEPFQPNLILHKTVVGAFLLVNARFDVVQFAGTVFPFPLPFGVSSSPDVLVVVYIIWSCCCRFWHISIAYFAALPASLFTLSRSSTRVSYI